MKTHTSIHRQNIFNSLVNCPKDLIDHGLVSLNSVAWNFFSVSHVDSSTEAFNPASTAFPEPLAGSWIGGLKAKPLDMKWTPRGMSVPQVGHLAFYATRLILMFDLCM